MRGTMSNSKLLLLALLCSAAANAQQGRGTILGTVTDSSGAAIAGAKVSIVNVDTNNITNAETNNDGFYTSPAVNVGNYQVTAEHAGFKKAVRNGIVLQIDQQAEINIRLDVGAISESVEVTGSAPLVNTENGSIGQVVENRNVEELPLNGRNAFALILLAPDVHSNAGPIQSGFADRGTSLSDWSINGGPNSVNNMLVDGMVASNSYYPDLNADLAVDAVQEFKVQSGSMSAEYGFTLGGVINVATKAGTNNFHGTAYEFVRNNVFDSRNAFAAAELPFRYNQYGLALGGPVILPKLYNGRNKTFFFGNWEQYNYINHSQSITSVPIASWRNGDFSNLYTATGALIPIYDPNTTVVNPNGSGYIRTQFPGNVIPTSRLDPVAQKINAFYPAPNLAPSNQFTQANNYLSSVALNSTMQQYTTRVDHRFSDADTFFARYTFFVNYTDNGTASPWPDPAVRARYDHFNTRNSAFAETHVFSPTIVNDFRVGTARQYFPFQAASYNEGYPAKLGFPANVPNTVFPLISDGYTAFSTGVVGLRGALTWDFNDTVTIVKGAHTIKVGMEYRLMYGNNYQTANPSGTFNFSTALTDNPQSPSGNGSTYADFILGAVSSASVGTYIGESERGYSLTGFVQDDYRVTSRLKLNLGLRYDYQQPPYERNCGTTNFNPYQKDPLGLLGRLNFACQDYGKTFLSPQYKNFAPRIGFAYDLRGDGHTILRGGYAIFSPQVMNLLYFGNTTGFAATTTSYNPPGANTNFPAFQLSQGFPTPPIQPLGKALGPDAFLGQSVSYDQGQQKVPMSQQWNVSVQRQLPGSWVIDLAYSGNHVTNEVAGNYNLDQLNPTYLSLGTALQNPVPNPYAGIVPGSLGGATITKQQSLLPYPYYTNIMVRNPHLGDSIYHAGMLTAQKRFNKGLTFLASYTKSKLISDSIAAPINFGNVVQTGVTTYQNGLFDRSLERAVDPTNVPQRLTISFVYELPVGKGKMINVQNNILNTIVGGWQAQGIMTLQTGLPIVITGASNNLATRPNSTGQSAKLSNPTQYEWFNTAAFVNPPNYTYGNIGRTLPDVSNPGFFNIDFSMIKNLRLSEKFSLQLRGEAFNLDNHTNLGMPNATFVPGTNGLNSSSTFGTITSAQAARSIQIGAKLIF